MTGQGFFGHPYGGLYIAIDGIRCCGKSTQVKELERAVKLNYPEISLFVTKEPGGTKKGDQIRQVIVSKPELSTANLVPRANILLFAASRAQTIAEKIVPCLDEGGVVISDRCVLSSYCYQGYGDLEEGCNYGWQFIHRINSWAVGGIFPDLIIVPEISAELSKERVDEREKRNNVYDGRPIDYYQRVAEAYHMLGERMKEQIWLIDGTKSVSAQTELIWSRVNKLITDKELTREISIGREREL